MRAHETILYFTLRTTRFLSPRQNPPSNVRTLVRTSETPYWRRVRYIALMSQHRLRPRAQRLIDCRQNQPADTHTDSLGVDLYLLMDLLHRVRVRSEKTAQLWKISRRNSSTLQSGWRTRDSVLKLWKLLRVTYLNCPRLHEDTIARQILI